MKTRIVILCILLLTADLGFASDCTVYEDYLHWHAALNGNGFALLTNHAKAESLIFTVTREDNLLISDVSDPDQPRFVSEMSFPLGCYHVWAQGPTAYVLCTLDEGSLVLAVLDVRNPQQPVITQTVPLDNWINDLGFQGTQVVYALRNQTLSIFEITAPDSLQHINTFATDYQIYDLAFHAGLVYAGTEDEMIIYDLSNPLAPVELSLIPGFSRSMVFDGDIMMKISTLLHFQSYDVSDALHPTLLDEVMLDFGVESIAFQDGLAVVATDDPTFLYSVSSEGQINLISKIALEPYFRAYSFFDEEHIYYCDSKSISIMKRGNELTAPTGPPTSVKDFPRKIEVRDDYAFLVYPNDNIEIYDLSDPTGISLAGSLVTSYKPQVIALQDNWAFVVGRDELTVFDISDPTLPQARGGLAGLHGNYITCVTLSGDTLWIYHDWANLEAVDVGDPINPQLLFSMDWDYYIEDMEAVGDLLHVADGDGNYRILSTATIPPSELGILNVSNGTSGISIQDDLALIGCSYYGVALVDISEPDAPVLLKQHSLTDSTADVLLSGDLALVGSVNSTQLLDVSTPQIPVNIGTVWEFSVRPRVLNDGSILICSGRFDFDLKVVPAPCEPLAPVEELPGAGVARLSIFPNPFNPDTSINFVLSEPTLANLSVHDLTGRLVRTLVSGEYLETGPHSRNWDGLDSQGRCVASGVYLVRLKAGKHGASGRVVLLK